MAKDPTKITNLGPGTITVGSTDLGAVADAKFIEHEQVVTVKSKTYGDAPMGGTHISNWCELKCLVEEGINFDSIAAIFEGATKVVGGTAATGTKLTFGKAGGQPMTKAEVTFESDDPAKKGLYDITIYKAILGAKSPELDLGPEQPAVREVTFIGCIDGTRTDGDLVYSFGNGTAVAAS